MKNEDENGFHLDTYQSHLTSGIILNTVIEIKESSLMKKVKWNFYIQSLINLLTVMKINLKIDGWIISGLKNF
jgi:hypothetical protein